MASDDEEPLAGGNASSAVVRIGDTVRKPWLPTTERTVELMDAVRSAGVDVPRTHGRDDAGRLVLEYVPGTMAIDLAPLDTALVRRVGAMLRTVHDACVELPVPADWPTLLPPPVEPDMLCHNDVATWNLVVGDDRLVLVDWDGAGPSTRAWDLAYAATAFAHLFPGADPVESTARLRAFFAGYGASVEDRAATVDALAARAAAMHTLLRDSHATGVEPWSTMFVTGHGEHWASTVAYVRRHRALWEAVAVG